MTGPTGPTGPTPAPLPADCVEALQAALAAEHRAVFGYGLLGPRLSGADRERAASCQAAHETLRDATELLLGSAGRTPVGPRADYPELFPVGSVAAARTLAARLEDGAAAAWRYAYATAANANSAGAALRPVTQDALTASAVRAVRWRAVVDPATAAVPFPGI